MKTRLDPSQIKSILTDRRFTLSTVLADVPDNKNLYDIPGHSELLKSLVGTP